MDKIGVIVGFGDVSEDQEAGTAVEGLTVSQVLADNVVGKRAGAAHDALFDIPGIRADLEHFEVVVGLEDETVGITEMKFHKLREIAKIGDDGNFCAVGAKGVADGISGIVRNREGGNFDVANHEALARANVFDTIQFFRRRLRENAADFDASVFGKISGSTKMSRELREAAGVVGMFMGNENAIEAFGRFANRCEAAKSFFAAQAGVNEERGAVCFQQRGVAGAA